MSIESVIKQCKSIESRLVKLGAEGRGLHEKLTSIEDIIENDLIKKIRFIASVRNKVIHEDEYDLTEQLFSDFSRACEDASDRLDSKLEATTSSSTTTAGNSSSDIFEQFEDASTWGKVGIIATGLAAIAAVITFR